MSFPLRKYAAIHDLNANGMRKESLKPPHNFHEPFLLEEDKRALDK